MHTWLFPSKKNTNMFWLFCGMEVGGYNAYHDIWSSVKHFTIFCWPPSNCPAAAGGLQVHFSSISTVGDGVKFFFFPFSRCCCCLRLCIRGGKTFQPALAVEVLCSNNGTNCCWIMQNKRNSLAGVWRSRENLLRRSECAVVAQEM